MPEMKKGFGGATVTRFSPPLQEGGPKIVSAFLSFEEALKLHLSIGQLLGHLNGLNRATREGRQRGLKLNVQLHNHRVVVYVAKDAESKASADDADE